MRGPRLPHYKFGSMILCFLTLIPSLALGQDNDRFTHWAFDDGVGLIREGVHRSPYFILGGVALLAAGSRADRYVREEIQEGYTGGKADFLDVANEFGNPMAVIPVTGVFAVSMLTHDHRFQDAAFTSLESWFYANSITFGIKMATGRYRPETGSGPRHFSPLSGNDSFPSGHTTTIFAVITPWVMYYPGVATYGLFALGASTAVARVARDKHWPTDVLAGAVVGVLTGRWLARRHLRGPDGGGSISFMPIVGPGATGLHLSLKFN